MQQQRSDVLREWVGNRRRRLRIDRDCSEIDGDRNRRYERRKRSSSDMQQRDPEKGDERYEITATDSEPALPPVEADVEREKRQTNGKYRCTDKAFAPPPAGEPCACDDQHRREKEKPAIRRDRDRVENSQRRTLQHAEWRAVR